MQTAEKFCRGESPGAQTHVSGCADGGHQREARGFRLPNKSQLVCTPPSSTSQGSYTHAKRRPKLGQPERAGEAGRRVRMPSGNTTHQGRLRLRGCSWRRHPQDGREQRERDGGDPWGCGVSGLPPPRPSPGVGPLNTELCSHSTFNGADNAVEAYHMLGTCQQPCKFCVAAARAS